MPGLLCLVALQKAVDSLLTPQAADLMTGCGIDKDIRDREKPSDHVPVWIELDA